MPIIISKNQADPDDTGGRVHRLPGGGQAADQVDESPWVTPDYSTIRAEADMVPGVRTMRDWPGPPLVMPAGLLPDGKPHGNSEMDNSYRIEGVRPRNEAEADACVRAYGRQQHLLRDELGLPYAKRMAPTFKAVDTPETLAAIAAVHQAERDRRRGLRRTG